MQTSAALSPREQCAVYLELQKTLHMLHAAAGIVQNPGKEQNIVLVKDARDGKRRLVFIDFNRAEFMEAGVSERNWHSHRERRRTPRFQRLRTPTQLRQTRCERRRFSLQDAGESGNCVSQALACLPPAFLLSHHNLAMGHAHHG